MDKQNSILMYENSILDTFLPSRMYTNGIILNLQNTSSCVTDEIGKCGRYKMRKLKDVPRFTMTDYLKFFGLLFY